MLTIVYIIYNEMTLWYYSTIKPTYFYSLHENKYIIITVFK